MRFKGKIAVVVGAASGIAAAAAKIFAREGAAVVCIDKNGEGLASLAAAIRAEGTGCDEIVVDALDEGQVAKAVAEIVAKHGAVDILVNAIGGSMVIENLDAPFEDLSTADWHKLLDYNILPTVFFSREIIPHMKRRKAGKIVNISSHAIHGIAARSSAYAAAKGAVSAMTAKLAIEVGPYNINCNAIAPSRTLSDRVAELVGNKPEAETQDYVSRIPLRRLATPEDQARVVCFLGSEDASYITGETIDVTGGQ